MNSNEGRNIYLHEILVDYLKNTEEYSNENIKKKLKLYYELQNKRNVDIFSLTTDEKNIFKKLEAFFNKKFEISFANSNLIYPRFKEAYNKAKAAVENVRTAYDNVVKEYYNIANRGYYESKDPKFYDYLNYIKKKILIAKINAGIIDDDIRKENNSDTVDTEDTENTENTENTEYIPHKLVIKNIINDPDVTSLRKTGYNSDDTSSDEEEVKSDQKELKINLKKNDPDPDPDTNSNETTRTNIQKAIKLNPLLLLPPPLFIFKGGDSSFQLNKNGIIKKPEKDDFKAPMTLQEKYIIEEKYIDKVITDFDDITEFKKIIKKIEDYIGDLNNFIYGNSSSSIDGASDDLNSKIKNFKEDTSSKKYEDLNNISKIKNFKEDTTSSKKYEDLNNIEEKLLDISSLKNEIISRADSMELKIYQDFDNSKTKTHEYIVYRDKYLKFLDEKLKDIYNKDIDEYVKNFPEIKKIINEDVKLNICINDLTKNIIEISKNFKQELSKNKKIIEDIEANFKLRQSNKNKLDIESQKANQYNRGRLLGKRTDGGSSISDNILKTLKTNRNSIERKSNELEIIFKDIQRQLKLRNQDPLVKTTLNNTRDGEPYVPGISIFDKIWKNYTTDIKDGKQIIENIEDKLYTNIKNNDLDPAVVLELTFEDRMIFIIIIFFIRQISLGVVEYYIDIGKIKDIIFSLLYYVIFYIILIIILTIFINLDNYKLRIIFNYLNLHINLYNILTHVFIIMSFSILIYSLIIIINFPIQNLNQKYISERDKIKLAYRLEILTLIIFVFSAIFVIVL